MKKIKNLFLTPKKAAISIICILAILCVLGAGSVFAANAIAESSSIGVENAKNFAFAEDGVDPVTATVSHAEFTFEQGHFVYDIEFTANDTKYKYLVKASNGEILNKEMDVITEAFVDGTADSGQQEVSSSQDNSQQEVSSQSGSQQEVSSSQDNSQQEISSSQDNSQQEVSSSQDSSQQDSSSQDSSQQNSSQQGTVYSGHHAEVSQSHHSTDHQSHHSSSQQGSSDKISLDAAKKKALSDAGVSASDATFTKAKLDTEDGISVYDIKFHTSSHEYAYEIDAATGAVLEKESKAHKNHSGSSGTSNYIGVDSAKSIALQHAGFPASDVTFKKAKLDTDDGEKVYEIEFYKDGLEYEYKINASTGDIIEYDIDD